VTFRAIKTWFWTPEPDRDFFFFRAKNEARHAGAHVHVDVQAGARGRPRSEFWEMLDGKDRIWTPEARRAFPDLLERV
jgi:hypothetical protein